MAFSNQGSRPNYPSTSQKLTYKKKPYATESHEKFVGTAISQLSEINECENQAWLRRSSFLVTAPLTNHACCCM